VGESGMDDVRERRLRTKIRGSHGASDWRAVVASDS
jgi:hypothetical protein